MGNSDDQDSGDPFSLDEEEQDITTFGRRSNANSSDQTTGDHHSFSVSRGLTSLFSASPERNRSADNFDGSLDESSSEGSGSDIDGENPPLEARTSLERRPLDVDDDEEMGEMVAPTEDSSNSSDEEVLSPSEKEKLGRGFGMNDADEQASEFAGQDDHDDDDDDDSDQLVEIAMPANSKRISRG